MIASVNGVHFGDEGKGKVIDYLIDRDGYNVCVRYNGGANAGHTVIVAGKKYVLHIMPSGIIACRTNIIGPGVVIEPDAFYQEFNMLRDNGIEVSGDNLIIDERAHLIMPWHKAIEKAEENARGKGRIGTTGRGIGPCYSDSVARKGVRVCDVVYDREVNLDRLSKRIREVITEKNAILSKVYGEQTLDADPIIEKYAKFGEDIKELVDDTGNVLALSASCHEDILFEGAQGTLLDISAGTYPYTTSSHTTTGGIAYGSGVFLVPERRIGVTKAYITRVGGGPFPTEIEGALGEQIRKCGGEYGATTGRPRECGWLDALAGKYANRLNGFTELAVTKLDVLEGIDPLKICTKYKHNGVLMSSMPPVTDVLEECEPVYESFEGFTIPRSSAGVAESNFNKWPAAIKKYIAAMEEGIGVPVKIISVGPERDSTIEK